MDVTLPDGTTVNGVPEGTTKAQLATKLKANGHSVPDSWLTPTETKPKESGWETAGRYAKEYLGGTPEAIAAGVSGAALKPLSDVAGLGAIPLHAAGLIKTDPTDVKAAVQGMAYEPRTELGKGITKAMALPGQLTGYLGNKAADAIASPKTSGPWQEAAGNLVREGVNQIPNVAGAGALKMMRDRPPAAGFAPPAAPGTIGPPPSLARPPVAPTVDPAALARQAQMKSLPNPIDKATRGQIARDPVQLRRESQISQTDAGEKLRDVYQDQNQTLLQNLDTIMGRTGMRGKTDTEVGQRVAGDVDKSRPGSEGALTQQANAAEKNINRLYRKAEVAGETQGPVKIDKLIDFLNEHDDPSQVSFAVDRLRKLGAIEQDAHGNISLARKPVLDEEGAPVKGEDGKPMTSDPEPLSLKQLEGIRRAAVAAQKDGGTKGYYAGQLKRQLDDITKGAGGAAYQAARKARLDYANKFEEPKSISQLIENKSRTDRTTALENVWDKTVLNGSLADLERVRDTLLKGADKGAVETGRKAWRDIAGQTVKSIMEDATKSATKDERGNPELSAAALKKSLDRFGDEKLEMILGKTASKQLRDIAEVTADLKTKPPSRISGSDTSVNLKVMKVLDHIPILGPVTKGAIRMAMKARAEGQASRDADTALKPPVAPSTSIPPPPFSERYAKPALPVFGAMSQIQPPPQ